MLWALKYFVAVNTLNIIMYLRLYTGAHKGSNNRFNDILYFLSGILRIFKRTMK